jgi:hypothetical protein
MDPATLALMVAPLIAKAAERFGGVAWDRFAGKAGEAGWDVLARLGTRVRDWFSDHDDRDGSTAMDVVIAAPDSSKAVSRLADVLASAMANDRELADELSHLVEEASQAGGEVGRFSVHVGDMARVGKITQIGSINTQGGSVNL